MPRLDHSNFDKLGQYTYWCYTLNNYTEVEIMDVQAIECAYNVYGKEEGKMGTPHLQGYIEMKSKKRFRTMKKLFPERTHLEPRHPNSNADACDTYCKKEGLFWTKGTISTHRKKQGERTDIASFVKRFEENPDADILAPENSTIFAKYYKFADYVKHRFTKQRSHLTPIVWIHGKTGTCKSRITTDIANAVSDIPAHYQPYNCKFWDGYENQPVVIIDEYRSNPELSYQDLLRLGDRYPLSVQVKGAMKTFNSKLIIITSSMSPYQAFRGIVSVDDHISQLIRRISDCINTDLADDELEILDDNTDLLTFNSDHYENRRSTEDVNPEVYQARIMQSCPKRYRSKVLALNNFAPVENPN